MTPKVSPRVVAILVYPDVQVIDVVGPHEVFCGANAATGSVVYDVRIVAATTGPVASESGLAVVASSWTSLPDPVDTIVVAGGPATRRLGVDSAEVRWLAETGPRARRLATVCTGAFLAAKAGLLAGRRVTTHWRHADRLQREHPELTVDADPIFIDDGSVWTSAGVTAGIDLALALVEADCGAVPAETIARELVMFLRRPGGQSQFAAPTWVARATPGPIREAQHLVDASPGDDHRVPVLAARVGMSERHFVRRFAEQVGVTPARYVEQVRLEAARTLLATEALTTEATARRCGFGTAETLRRAFHRHLGVAPDDYRRRFAASRPSSVHPDSSGG